MKTENLISIRVWGDFACFTRPEMKVERVSYPIMTPSAARGVVEAIFWEPQMYYLIHQITVIKHAAGGREYGKGRWVSFQRNEVCKTVSPRTAQQWMNKPEKFEPIVSGAGSGTGNIAQRNTLALAGVAYMVTAEICLTDLARPPRDTLQKYKDELKRRSTGGKCHCRPALGCREFAADFDWIEPEERETIPRFPWPEEDLGLMLYDVFHHAERQRGFAWFNPIRNYAQLDYPPVEAEAAKKRRHFGLAVQPRACFFPAKVTNAIMECHPENVEIRSVPGKQGYNAATNG
jgi:CRISPR-associated protein Cas5d